MRSPAEKARYAQLDLEDNLVRELVTQVEVKEPVKDVEDSSRRWWQQKAALQLVPPWHSSCQLEDQGQGGGGEGRNGKGCLAERAPGAYL